MSVKDVESFLEGASHDWKWEHVEGNIYYSQITVNSINYEVLAKLMVKGSFYEYEILEINILNTQLN